MLKKPDINATLTQRDSIYGDFTMHASITQSIKSVMYYTVGWEKLTPDKKQALEVIADKIGRILNGNPEYADNWHDIAGYAMLAEQRVKK